MYIVQVSSELAPVAKVGGLADVVYGLSRELEVRGHAVELILPKYDNLWYDQIWGLHNVFPDLWVPWGNGAVHCHVYFGFVHGRKTFFIESHSPDNFFHRGHFYGSNDDNMRFAFFCKAAMEFLLKSGKRPDIIHCHDWQTGLIPVLLYEVYQNFGMSNSRVCYTIHNFRHQGLAGENILWTTMLGRPEYYFHHDRLQDNFNKTAINFMKAGIVYSNFVTTVSPHHAHEAQTTDQGFGLQDTLHRHGYKYGGVLNGVDYDVWNTEKDPMIPHHYNIETLDTKYANKDALRDRLLMRKTWTPVIAYVGRLDSQKGVHLIRHALFWALNNGAQFVLLGSSPDRSTNDHFWHLKHMLNNNEDCHLELGFSEQLAHLIYAGADMILVPSMYEPCGLTQMIGLRYGTVPIVRSVGGLSDTVFDRNFDSGPLERRNGFVFHNADHPGVESALERAVGLWYCFPDDFRNLMINGMRMDFSWNIPGHHYSNIFEYIRHK
ncbi:MAG: glycogen synthase GlgA [Alphaproteobacteria bacterium]|jgi:starch synthase|nr:glycogen synthase GlgA [Alphaproteobacteria bacterium]